MSVLTFSMLLLGAAAFLLLPLALRSRPDATGRAAERAALKAQLVEAERDAASGLLEPLQHEEMRAEIARRLFRLEDEADGASSAGVRSRPVLLAAALVVPLAAAALYMVVGRPGVPSLPFAARADAPATLARLETRLVRNPNDMRGWLMAAPIYRQLERPADAVRAYDAALRADLPAKVEASVLTERAEAASLAQNAPVAPVRASLERAVALDPSQPKPRFLLAIAREEGGDPQAARAAWQELLDRFPDASEPWVAVARDRLARAERAANGQAIASLPAGPRNDAIEGMVASLASRLDGEPDDVDGWTRLIRSYAVLGRAGAARSAYDRAARHFSGRPVELARLRAQAEASGVAVE